MSEPCTHLGQLHVVASFEPGEDWGWCYVDQLLLEPAP